MNNSSSSENQVNGDNQSMNSLEIVMIDPLVVNQDASMNQSESRDPQPLEEVLPRHDQETQDGFNGRNMDIDPPRVPQAQIGMEEPLRNILRNVSNLNDTQQAQLRYLLNHSDRSRAEDASVSSRGRKRRFSEDESNNGAH